MAGEVSGSNVPPGPPGTAYYCENGRFYHAFRKGKYMFPCDEEEKDRLDIFHQFFLVARQNLLHSSYLQPGPGGPRILDLGCGTGIWAIDIAEKYYPSKVHGLDLSMIQPEEITVNLQFSQWDIESSWAGLDIEPQDLIYMRTLYGSICDWPRLYGEIYRHLRPGAGWVEQVEIDWTPYCDDGTLPPGSAVQEWTNELLGAMDDFSRPMRINPDVTMKQLADAGFSDIRQEVIKVPYSGWPNEPMEREIGRWFNLGVTQGLEALSLAPLNRMRYKSIDEIRELTTRVRNEICSRRIHAYCHMYVWTGRRAS